MTRERLERAYNRARRRSVRRLTMAAVAYGLGNETRADELYRLRVEAEALFVRLWETWYSAPSEAPR